MINDFRREAENIDRQTIKDMIRNEWLTKSRE